MLRRLELHQGPPAYETGEVLLLYGAMDSITQNDSSGKKNYFI